MDKELKDYPCTMCGACCKHVDVVVKHSEVTDPTSPFYFPHRWDATGRCEHLSEENRCRIYSSRPLICNIDRIVTHLELDKAQFYRDNIKACNVMMELDGVEERYRIEES